jgi:drug/metabolite transporter (DMT)-like permease
MDRKISPLIAEAMLFSIALIWGSTFIIVKKSISNITPVAFNSIRFLIASSLLTLIFIYRPKKIDKKVLIDGSVLGLVLFLTFTCQTIGLKFVTASETGFITGLYLIFVPLLSIFIGKKVDFKTIIAVLVAFSGLFLISFTGKITVGVGEFLVLLNALFVAFHILLVDYYGRRDDVFALTSIQIFVLTFLSILYTTFFEGWNFNLIINFETIIAFLITGVFATVVAFLVQTFAQKYTTPTKAAIIFTFEPLSSAFFAYFLGGEILRFSQYIGAFLIIISMLLIEIKFERNIKDA